MVWMVRSPFFVREGGFWGVEGGDVAVGDGGEGVM